MKKLLSLILVCVLLVGNFSALAIDVIQDSYFVPPMENVAIQKEVLPHPSVGDSVYSEPYSATTIVSDDILPSPISEVEEQPIYDEPTTD